MTQVSQDRENSSGVTVGIVGMGKRGRKHLAAALGTRGMSVAFTADPFTDVGQPGVPHLRHVLPTDLAAVDGVVIAVPHSEAIPNVKQCAAEGTPMLLEKPLGRNVQEARTLHRLGRESGVPVFVAAQRRFDPAIRRLADEIHKSEPPRGFRSEYTLGLTGVDDGWRATAKIAGGGAVLDMGYHTIDMLEFVFGSPKSVRCALEKPHPINGASDVEPGADLLLDYSDGFSGAVAIGRYRLPPTESTTVWFADHALVLNGEGLRRFDADGSSTLLARTSSSSELLLTQMAGFAEALRGNDRLLQTAESACDTMETIGRCYDSVFSMDADGGRIITRAAGA